jgi:hypothetical protein
MAGADQTREWSIGWDVGGWNCDKNQNSRDAIDIPLDFSDAFIQLVTQSKAVASIEASNTNPYLFRRTEHYLFEQGLSPLSAIKDMIGSQATKGMHVLARFAPKIVECGVWSDGSNLTAIEAYPSARKRSETIQALRRPYPVLSHADCEDALTCALVASLFAEKRGALKPPEADVSPSEGWIWVPRDAFAQDAASSDCT